MFEFGRELKRILGTDVDHDELDPSLLELLDSDMLAVQARAQTVDAGRVSTRDPFPFWIRASALWREHARRSGDPISLRKAASAAQAAVLAANNGAESGRAVLEQALISLTGIDLYGDMELMESADEQLKLAAACDGDPLFEVRLEAAYARLASRQALARDNWDRALEAAALFDGAVRHFERLAGDRGSAVARTEAAAARTERADLLAGFGVRLKEARLLREAIEDLEVLLPTLDKDYEPLTWARAAEILGSTQVALGEMDARPERIAEGVSTLVQGEERASRDHSPLDWARRQHALGVGLQALGEACDCDEAFAQAEEAFDAASAMVGTAPLAIRATLAGNRAACLARIAERRGDLVALGRAETAFRTELAVADAASDPVSWAVLQVNLARIYESRAELMGAFPDRQAAIYSLETALDVFCERGLKTLAETASAGLERINVKAA